MQICSFRTPIVLTLFILTGLPLGSFTTPHPSPFSAVPIDEAVSLYTSIDAGEFERPDYEVFHYGTTGLDNLKKLKKFTNESLITLIDFRKPSNEKRLWVIDLERRKVLYQTLVAHGRNSGELYARSFSNAMNSHQSSLGFYLTGTTYIGKHGLSMKLHGLEDRINDQSEARAIVMHGADYVSDIYSRKYGRLGRSFGCPAIPLESYKQIIKEVAGGTCLFIYYPDQAYLNKTQLINYTGSLESLSPRRL